MTKYDKAENFTRIRELETRIETQQATIARLQRQLGESSESAENNPPNHNHASAELEQTLHLLEDTNSQLTAEKERIRVTLESLNEAVITADNEGYIDYVNPSAETLLKKTAANIVGSRLSQVIHLVDEETRLPIPIPLSHDSSVDKLLDIEMNSQPLLLREDGSEIAIDWSHADIALPGQQPIGKVITFRDITDAHNLKLQLTHQATHDPLTSLLNRAEFDRRLKNILEYRQDNHAPHSLLYVDLDQFKVVNDTCGHRAGDQLLKQLGALLKTKIRGRDTLARLGGDEFGVLLEYCPPEKTLMIAEEILKLIQEFRFYWTDKTFSVGASIGIVNFTSDNASQIDPLSAADAACYKAKDAGRNRLHVHQWAENAGQMHGEMGWVSRINAALEDNSFELFQQTIKPVNKYRKMGLHFEVLIRMRDAEGHLIPPGAFLPAAERYNLISKIDYWVIHNTFKWLSQNPETMAQVFACSINLSGLSLSSESLMPYVKNCFKVFKVPFEKICFEITETSAIQNLDRAQTFIRSMKKLGCTFALDDFGTGMSSFSYLKQLPVDKLKIDGSFVSDISDDPIDHAMVRSINDIGHVMGMETVAEFVETREILDLLTHLGVDYAQGYYIAKPQPMDALRPMQQSA